jgi:arginine decarboxylase
VLAAKLFGAKHSFFLCNGSTGGVMAALLAAVQAHMRGKKKNDSQKKPNDIVVILPRNAHKSAVQGLIVSGIM